MEAFVPVTQAPTKAGAARGNAPPATVRKAASWSEDVNERPRQLPRALLALAAANAGCLRWRGRRRRRGTLAGAQHRCAVPPQGASRAKGSHRRHRAGPGAATARRATEGPSVLERTTFEAGARLVQEAVRATESSNPTEFQYKSQDNRSYVSQQAALAGDVDLEAVDDDGLPLVYSVERIAKFWDKKPEELAERWSRFLRISTPFITRFFYSIFRGTLWEDEADLARQAVDNMTALGPTFVKLGQVLSIRPDVLPPVTMKELARLQDNIKPFSTEEARELVVAELGKPIEELFSDFSEEPIAAASLAQVYRATLRETGQEVAVKVQRPGALATVSKDLYVLRRLADVAQPLIRRFTQDETDYIALTETFAEGLYTELDFRNEALNAKRMQELLQEKASSEAMNQLVIPEPLMDLTTRRVMLSRWVHGVKLSTLPADEIQQLLTVGQELFLTQLLEIGFFHGDPHPGNLLKITEGPDAGKLCLLDFGLVAQVPQEDRDIIVASVIHLGTQNWEGLIDDFVTLGFLAADTDRSMLIPILQRILGPYLRGGGAQSMKNANFQDLSQDLLKVNTEVKFSIPPYVSLLARSVATLEGIALQGDPQYQIVAQAYPFVVRKLLKNDNRLSFQVLRDLLYDPKTLRLRPQRLSTMLQASLGVIATSSKIGFIDFDTAPDDGAPLTEVVRFLLSDEAANLRPLLSAEIAYGLDLALRRTGRRLRNRLQELLTPRVPLLGFRLPTLPAPPLLVPMPGADATPSLQLMSPDAVVDAVLPPLTTAEDVDLDTITEAVQAVLFDGSDGARRERGELLEPSLQTFQSLLSAALNRGTGAAEVAEALRQAIRVPSTRSVLTDDVISVVVNEILQTWRARLSASE